MEIGNGGILPEHGCKFMDKPLAFGQKTHDGFNKLTYASPAQAFIGNMFEQQGVPWPRKPLGGKPQMTKGKGGRGSRSLRHKKSH